MRKKAFTLIELIAVIAILAILGAVLVPKITGYTQFAKRSNYRSSAKVIVNAVQAYNAGNSNNVIAVTDKFGDNVTNLALMKLINNNTQVTGKNIDKFKDFSIGQIKTISNGDFKVIGDEIKDLNGTDNIITTPID